MIFTMTQILLWVLHRIQIIAFHISMALHLIVRCDVDILQIGGCKSFFIFLVPILKCLHILSHIWIVLFHSYRILQHSGVYPDYDKESADLAAGRPNVKNVTLLLGDWWGSGIVHAKVWISDGKDIYIGSANNDWKSLTQVLGCIPSIRAPFLISFLGDVIRGQKERK